MNKTSFFVLALVIGTTMLSSFAYAGSINEDCTRQEDVCTNYETVCDRWWHGWCIDWGWVCTEHVTMCTDSVLTETEIDADTVQGMDIVGYVDANDEAWSEDRKGVSWSTVENYLLGDYWDKISLSMDERFEAVNERLDLLLANGDPVEALRLKTARLGVDQHVNGIHCYVKPEGFCVVEG